MARAATRRWWTFGAVAAGLAMGPAAWGQGAPEDPVEPGVETEEAAPLAPLDESVREAAEDLSRPAHGRVVFRAADPGAGVASTIPGIVLPDVSPPGGVLLPEGSFLPRRRGIVVPVGDIDWAFVPDEDAVGDSEPPMLLLPSRRLEEMVRLVEGRGEAVTFVLDAQVYVYRGRNLLLPIRFETEPVERATAPTREAEAEAAIEANREILGEGSATGAALDELLERLDRSARPRRAAGPEREAPAQAGGRTEGAAEGRWIVQRPGRIARGARGRWVFVPENDVEGDRAGGSDVPLILMPCLNLERLEALMAERGESLRVSISGPVFSYGDRVIVNPTMFVVSPGAGNLRSAR